MKCECECIFYINADNVSFFPCSVLCRFCGTYEKNICVAAARDNSICVSGKCSLFVRSLDLESLIFIPIFFLSFALRSVRSFLISRCVWVVRIFDYNVPACAGHGPRATYERAKMCEWRCWWHTLAYTFVRHTFLWSNKNVPSKCGAIRDLSSRSPLN